MFSWPDQINMRSRGLEKVGEQQASIRPAVIPAGYEPVKAEWDYDLSGAPEATTSMDQSLEVKENAISVIVSSWSNLSIAAKSRRAVIV